MKKKFDEKACILYRSWGGLWVLLECQISKYLSMFLFSIWRLLVVLAILTSCDQVIFEISFFVFF